MEPIQNVSSSMRSDSGNTQNDSDNAQNDLNKPVFRKDSKKNSGIVIGVVFLIVLMLVGIGFGVWMMMNKKEEGLDSQITDLEQQNNELKERVLELEGIDEEEDEEYVDDEDITEEDYSEEEGFYVLSIGDCIADGGTAASSGMSVKCDAVTDEGEGKFVYDSESNSLKFVME